jgi:hypothetical protein
MLRGLAAKAPFMGNSDRFAFTDVDFPIREDLRAAFQEAWLRIAEPGNWFDGRERVEIAAESRRAFDCGLCRRRREALSPNMVSGTHDSRSDLPEAVVEVVHRVVTDQSRITRGWVDDLIKAGINGGDAEGEYVEIVGLVVLVFSIDEFMRGIGPSPEPLPEPLPGEPTKYRPPDLETDTGFVPMLPPDGNTGEESDLWGEMTANVLRALSLVPNCVRNWMKLSDAMYLPMRVMAQPGMETGRAIDRMQTELVASRVSSHNECFY